MAEFHFAIQGGGAALEQQGSKPAMSRIAYAAAMLMMVAGYAAADPVAAERLSEGRRIAETWCANCHLVGPAAPGPATDAAPPFHAIAAMPSTTAMSLRVFLSTPHSRMPDYRLTNDQIDAVSDWILSQGAR
jgi:mono/diheme cytochrome c family protein